MHPATPAELPQIVDDLGGQAVDSMLRAGRLRLDGGMPRNAAAAIGDARA
jgi:hypothetical protein